VYNVDDAIIDTINLSGGIVINGSRINEMTYFNGTYDDFYLYVPDALGSIGTLTLAGNSTNNTGSRGGWGQVDNLAFHSNGNGIVSIAAFANGDFAAAAGMQVQDTVNLDYGTLQLNLVDFAVTGDDWFATSFLNGLDIADLFGAASAFGELNAFDIYWNADGYFDLLGAKGWSISDVGMISYSDPNVVPEPATLAIVGLGLAGLGWARRRRK